MTHLDDLLDMFSMVEGTTRLELLHDYGQKFPRLPEVYHPLRDAGMYMVHECQAPVFLKAEMADGLIRLVADVPREAPTARGFIGLLIELFDGETREKLLEAPDDLLDQLGILPLLGMQRRRGLTAIYQSLKAQVQTGG